MKLHILSDLHNEFLRVGIVDECHPWFGTIPETDADVIVLAGDIDTGVYGINWIVEASRRLDKPIVYVLGNHEFYRHEYYSLKKDVRGICQDTNVYLLDCDEFELNHVRILGLTLWTDYLGDKHMPQDLAMFHANKGMIDHQLIRYKVDDNEQKFKPIRALSIHESVQGVTPALIILLKI